MPGYNGSHPESMNGPNHNPPHPSMNRMPPYPGMDNGDVERQYGSGHGMPLGGGNTGRTMGVEGMNGRLEDPAFPRRPPMDQPSPHHMPMEQSMHGRPMGDGRMMPGDNRHDFGMPQSMYHCYSPAQMAGFRQGVYESPTLWIYAWNAGIRNAGTRDAGTRNAGTGDAGIWDARSWNVRCWNGRTWNARINDAGIRSISL